MGIFIFLNPFPHTTAIKEICFYLSVIIVTILILKKKTDFTFITPLSLPFGLFIFWSFLSIFWAINVDNSIHDLFSHLIRYVILYYILINYFDSEKHLLFLSWIIIISSTIFIMGGVIYFYFILESSLNVRFGVYTFDQTSVNVIGIISVFAIFLTLNHFGNERQIYHKIFLVLCFIILSLGLAFTQSRSNFLAIFIGGLFFFINNKKRMFVFISCFIIIMAISPMRNRFTHDYLSSFMSNRQFDICLITFEVIKDYPITGIGFGLQSYEKLDLKKYREKLRKKYRTRNIITDPHNIVLDIAVRLGIVGFIFSFYIVYVFFKMCRDVVKFGKNNFLKNWTRCLIASFFGFLVIGLFEPVFSHMPETVLCVVFSMTTVLWHLNSNITTGTIREKTNTF